MADVIVDLLAPEDLAEVVELYNQIYRPPRDADHFSRRYLGRHNVVQMVARLQERPIGFLLGFELKPRTMFLWFIGVLPSHRRQGVASQLLDAFHEWSQQNEYDTVRFECFNQQRAMIQLALNCGYDVVGLRYDADHSDNLIQLQKNLNP